MMLYWALPNAQILRITSRHKLTCFVNHRLVSVSVCVCVCVNVRSRVCECECTSVYVSVYEFV